MDGEAYIEDFYYEFEALPPLFYEKIVNLENRIINEIKIDDIVSLGCLYKV